MNIFFEFALALYVGIALFYCFVAFGDRRRTKGPTVKAPPTAAERSHTDNPDEQYDAQLAHLGATYGPRGWLLALWCTQFKSGNVHWEPTDSDTLEGIAQLLESHAHSRVLIEACSETQGNRSDPDESFPAALAAVRNLLDRGGNHGRIYTHCPPGDSPVLLDSSPDVWLHVCRIEILFSDTAGRFGPTANALVGGSSCA